MKKRAKKSVPHEAGLNEELKDNEFAAHFLTGIMADSPPEEACHMLVEGILQIAKARGVSAVANSAGILREAVYQAFTKKGNPTLSTLHGVLDGIGVEMTFRAKKVAR